jgi:hypothetical protein
MMSNLKGIVMHRRPRFAKLSCCDVSKVMIAAMHPDFSAERGPAVLSCRRANQCRCKIPRLTIAKGAICALPKQVADMRACCPCNYEKRRLERTDDYCDPAYSPTAQV